MSLSASSWASSARCTTTRRRRLPALLLVLVAALLGLLPNVTVAQSESGATTAAVVKTTSVTCTQGQLSVSLGGVQFVVEPGVETFCTSSTPKCCVCNGQEVIETFSNDVQIENCAASCTPEGVIPANVVSYPEDFSCEEKEEHRYHRHRRQPGPEPVKQRTLTNSKGNSVTRLGDFLYFGQLFKAFGNN